jgi:hypothetical protein
MVGMAQDGFDILTKMRNDLDPHSVSRLPNLHVDQRRNVLKKKLRLPPFIEP